MYKVISDYTLWRIIKDSKKYRLVLYADRRHTKALESVLPYVDVSIDYYVYDNPDERQKSVYDLMFENSDEVMVIVGFDDFKRAAQIVEGMGFSLGINYKNLDRYSEENWAAKYPFDPVLGYNNVNKNSQYEGFKVFGDANSSGLRILTLGGSTSDPYLYPFKSWSECLHDSLNVQGVENVVFCGGCAGFSSGQELFKLIRDGLILKPDIVINYSGYNDCFLHTNPYICGYAKQICTFLADNCNKSAYVDDDCDYSLGINGEFKEAINDFYDFWIKNQKMMEVICKSEGIKHITISQPTLFSHEKDLYPCEEEYVYNTVYVSGEHYSRSELKRRTGEFCRLAAKDSNKYDWLFDFKGIFDGIDAFIDMCHVNETGNQKIADEIIKLL